MWLEKFSSQFEQLTNVLDAGEHCRFVYWYLYCGANHKFTRVIQWNVQTGYKWLWYFQCTYKYCFTVNILNECLWIVHIKIHYKKSHTWLFTNFVFTKHHGLKTVFVFRSFGMVEGVFIFKYFWDLLLGTGMPTSISLLLPIYYCLWTGSTNTTARSLPIGFGLLFLVFPLLLLRPYNCALSTYRVLLILVPGHLFLNFFHWVYLF